MPKYIVKRKEKNSLFEILNGLETYKEIHRCSVFQRCNNNVRNVRE